jgi:legumain
MRCLIVVCALMAVAMSATVGEDKPKLWALLVAGSDGWYNYRHQSDVCHAYQILHAHGIPDENIVVMMKDDIANNPSNPTKGIIINHVDGKDVYKGVPKDYIGKDVTPKNFLNILLGKKDAMRGIGSGKVIESGPKDHVFVNFVDHGATGLVAFPVGELTVKELNDALKQMHDQKRYDKLVLYIEACESGSMFRNVLPDNLNIFATTASDYDESSYACYYDSKRGTYLGDVYSVNWMEDSDAKDIEKESLQTQFELVKKITNTSRVMEYGDMSLNKMPVGEFQGEHPATPVTYTKPTNKRVSASWDVAIDILYIQLEAATTETEKNEIIKKIEDMLDKRDHMDAFVKKIVLRVAQSQAAQERLVKKRPMQLTKLDCHTKLVHGFSQTCFNFGKNTYALKHAYVLANICEAGFEADDVLRTMSKVCKDITVREGIH